MRTPKISPQVFKDRRQRLGSLIPGAAVILPAHPHHIRNHDVHYEYRQDSNLFYLTGFEEPESILLFRPGKTPETVLFVRLRDVERETWDGFRYGPEGAIRHFGVDAAYAVEDFEKIASELLYDIEKVYYTLFKDEDFDRRIAHTLKAAKEKRRRSGRGLLPIYDSYQLIGEMRLRKSEFEMECLRKAGHISGLGHRAVMSAVKPGMNEKALEGIFLKEIMALGAARQGYGSIVASGANATTLHYVFNDQDLKDGELLLVDAGAEFQYYTGDITRTYPVNGKFSPVQKRIYNQLLDLQKMLIEKVSPSVRLMEMQETTIDGIIEILMREKVLSGSAKDIRESGKYRKYYMHGVSHLLGSDVHDAGTIEVNGQSRMMEPGMVITVEPGIYFPIDDSSISPELRGLGLRIEDDVAVTQDGREVLTNSAPKEIAELEDLIGRDYK